VSKLKKRAFASHEADNDT